MISWSASRMLLTDLLHHLTEFIGGSARLWINTWNAWLHHKNHQKLRRFVKCLKKKTWSSFPVFRWTWYSKLTVVARLSHGRRFDWQRLEAKEHQLLSHWFRVENPLWMDTWALNTASQNQTPTRSLQESAKVLAWINVVLTSWRLFSEPHISRPRIVDLGKLPHLNYSIAPRTWSVMD